MKHFLLPLLLISLGTFVHAQVYIGFNYTTPIGPVVNAGNDTSVTENKPFNLNGSISGGNSPFTSYWSPGMYLNDSTLVNPTAILPSGQTFTFTVRDDKGCLATDQVVIAVTPDGIEDLPGSGIRIYPNPNQGKITIEGFPENGGKGYELFLRTTLGETAYHENIRIEADRTDISLTGIAPGIYFLELVGKEQKRVFKIFIQ
jgi:hypothetical protein